MCEERQVELQYTISMHRYTMSFMEEFSYITINCFKTTPSSRYNMHHHTDK